MKLALVSLLLFAASFTFGEWKIQPSGAKAQFRGVSVVNERVAWLAGSMGTFGRTIDGDHWECHQIPGAEKLMFRSVVGFDDLHAVLLAIGPGDQSRIFRTEDGGRKWQTTWVNQDPKAFYDSIAFWDSRHGIGFSDPVGGKFPLIRTSDGGKTWGPISDAVLPEALTAEGAFSASGNCIVVSGKSDVWIATGGAAKTRVFHSVDAGETWTVAQTPIAAGKETSGIFGLRFQSPTHGIAVGGDYKAASVGQQQVAFTSDGGKTWQFASEQFPTGLRESAAFVGDLILVVGPNGSDVSADLGRTWRPVSGTPAGLHACEFRGLSGWAAGDNGLIAKWRCPGRHRANSVGVGLDVLFYGRDEIDLFKEPTLGFDLGWFSLPA